MRFPIQVCGFLLATCVALAIMGHSATPAVALQRVAPVASQNFVVYAEDASFARRIADEAERFRRELSMDWLGYEIKPWNERCPITVEIGMHAGGETSFAFMMPPQGGRGYPTGWQMKIFGSPERLLDAVLPHEITHTIFATHFGRPLPRWADEGACTTVEHVSERSKNHNMLISFLGGTPSRGIPFNRMFTMKNYPHDILPLYAQGYSLAKFLIQQKGRRHFLDYLSTGMSAEQPGRELAAWDGATDRHYGYKDLSELQLAWMDWVRSGASGEHATPQTLAARPARSAGPAHQAVGPEATLAARSATPDERFVEPGQRLGKATNNGPAQSVANLPVNQGWYAKQMKNSRSSRRIAASRQSIDVPGSDAAGEQLPDQVVLPPNPSKTIWR